MQDQGTRRFDEADVLRAAAIITDLLGDYAWHTWRECVDECRELVDDGSRREASKIAWRALHEPLADLRMEWDGPKGDRRLALRPTAEIVVQRTPCPKCGAIEGEPCVRLGNAAREPKRWPHEQRENLLVWFLMKLAGRSEEEYRDSPEYAEVRAQYRAERAQWVAMREQAS